MNLPVDDLKAGAEAIGRELLSAEVLTLVERAKVADATAGLVAALAAGDPVKIGNYRNALNTYLGVAELRAARATDKAALRLANLGLDLLVKVAIAAIA